MTYSQKFVTTWLAMLLPISSVMAEWAPSQAEMAALPEYCAAKFGEGANPEAAAAWRSTMGGDFIHIHHYCAGLNFMNRARRTFSSKNNGALEAAVREIDYVLTNSSPGFYLRPEMLMNRGIALSMMNRNGEAVGNLLQAIELDPRQPRAYMALADLYDKQKNRGKALETVTEGLRHNPDTKSLQRRYTELGGKLPYPAAIQPASIEAPAAKPGAAAAPVATSPAEPVTGMPATVAPVAVPASEPIASPKIGSPKNPYCRFCPD